MKGKRECERVGRGIQVKQVTQELGTALRWARVAEEEGKEKEEEKGEEKDEGKMGMWEGWEGHSNETNGARVGSGIAMSMCGGRGG